MKTDTERSGQGWNVPGIAWILALYLALGSAFVLLNPLYESPDEIHHVPMVQYLAENGLQLPSQEPGTVGLWQQQGNQPPLYYMIGALLIQPFDTSDINDVLRVNPHADIGIIRPDFNANRIVHRPAEEAFPGRGTVAATYLLRFYSLLLGAGTVFITYRLGRELLPEKPAVALGAAAFNAILPMFLYISASVNNDNLSTLLASALLLLLVMLLKRSREPDLRTYALIGLLTGAGLLAKLNIGLLIPVVALTLLVLSVRLRRWQPLIIGGVISGGLTILIAGWWYWRNWQLFGDVTGLDRFLDIVGRRTVPADMAQLWTERESFVRTFWGLFGSITVSLPETIYLLLNLLALAGLIGTVAYLLKQARVYGLSDSQNVLPMLLVIAWPLLTFGALLRWSSMTPASQGRLLFGALSCLSLWLAVGWISWLPVQIRRVAPLLIALVFGSVSVYSLTVITRTYAPPAELAFDSPSDTALFTGDVFDAPLIAIANPNFVTERVQAGEYVRFSFDAQLQEQEATPRNYSLFVHLVNQNGSIIAQRDVYPGGGRLATEDMSAGFAWRNHVAVQVPRTAYAPQVLSVLIGWYHLPTGERLILNDGSERLQLNTVELVEKAGDVPNPLDVMFGSRIELIGYDVLALQAAQGETIELTLYWQALQPISRDYVVFANIIDPPTLTKYAASNAMPANWQRPTTTWQPGERIEDTHTLTINPDAPPGSYPIEVGLYLQEEGFPRLSVTGTYENYIHLNPISIKAAPMSDDGASTP